MCDECKKHPCHPRCPNADEPIAHVCDMCGGSIFVGDEMYVIYDDTFCEDCIRDSKTYAE